MSLEQVGALREQLFDAGYRPVPVLNGDKRPLGKEWTDQARLNPPACIRLGPVAHALSTGILCDGLRAIDYDIDDKDIAAQCRAIAAEMFGEAPMRFRRNSPRFLVLYRATEGSPPKVSLAGKHGKIEALGRGQQFVAFGAHPSGAMLEWFPDAPGAEKLDTLPAISEEQLFEFFCRCAPIIGADPPQRLNGHEAAGGTAPAEGSALEIAASLAADPNNGPTDWEHWNKVGMAVWRACGGAAWGFELFNDWSARHPSYSADATRERWNHYPTSPPTQTGLGKLLRMAREAPKPEEPTPDQRLDEGQQSPLIRPCMLEGTAPERQWLVAHWIPMVRVTGLYGAGGEGKTTLAQMLGTATSIGADWLGLKVRQCNSLLVFCEDDIEEMWRRQEDINRHYNCSMDNLPAMLWWPRLGFDNELMTFEAGKARLSDFYSQVLDAALKHEAKLVLLDTLADIFGGSEIERRQARAFVQTALGGIARETGAAVVGLGHPSLSGIASGTGTSGSTGWDGAFRSRLYLSTPKADGTEQDHDARTLTRGKANYAKRGETIELRWNDGVYVPTTPPAGIMASIERQTCEKVFLQLLTRFQAEGRQVSDRSRAGNYAPRVFSRCPDRQRFTERDFTPAMERLFAQQEIMMVEALTQSRHKTTQIVLRSVVSGGAK